MNILQHLCSSGMLRCWAPRVSRSRHPTHGSPLGSPSSCAGGSPHLLPRTQGDPAPAQRQGSTHLLDLAYPKQSSYDFSPIHCPVPLSPKFLGKGSFHSSKQSIFISLSKTPTTIVYCLQEGSLQDILLRSSLFKAQQCSESRMTFIKFVQQRMSKAENSKYWQLREQLHRAKKTTPLKSAPRPICWFNLLHHSPENFSSSSRFQSLRVYLQHRFWSASFQLSHSRDTGEPVLTSQSLVRPLHPFWLLFPTGHILPAVFTKSFKTNYVCEPTTYGPAFGPGTSTLLRAIQRNLGSSLPKRLRCCHQHGKFKDHTELGWQEVLRCFTLKSLYPPFYLFFFFPLAPLIHAGSITLLYLLKSYFISWKMP